MFDGYIFTSPATGLSFQIVDDGDFSYINHPITGDKIPLLYDAEKDMLMIPAYAFRYYEMITPDEAAHVTGLTRQHICYLARQGKIKSLKTGSRSLLVYKHDVMAYTTKDDE